MTARTLVQIPEPLLGFGFGQQMEHPKDGLFLFGPLADNANPAEMRIGVVGTEAGIACFHEWARRIRGHISGPRDLCRALIRIPAGKHQTL